MRAYSCAAATFSASERADRSGCACRWFGTVELAGRDRFAPRILAWLRGRLGPSSKPVPEASEPLETESSSPTTRAESPLIAIEELDPESETSLSRALEALRAARGTP